MSGGHFNYSQFQITQIANDIEQEIIDNKDERYGYANNYSELTLSEFKEGIIALRRAYIFAQRIDWLLSGDDGEDNFHKRLKTELENHNE